LKPLKTAKGDKPDQALILVAHSLGGSLVKETPRRSQGNPYEEKQAIFDATVGVIFFLALLIVAVLVGLLLVRESVK
jgi:hypothetical protein